MGTLLQSGTSGLLHANEKQAVALYMGTIQVMSVTLKENVSPVCRTRQVPTRDLERAQERNNYCIFC